MSEQTIAERLVQSAGDIPALLKAIRLYSFNMQQIADNIVYTFADGSQIKFQLTLSKD